MKSVVKFFLLFFLLSFSSTSSNASDRNEGLIKSEDFERTFYQIEEYTKRLQKYQKEINDMMQNNIVFDPNIWKDSYQAIQAVNNIAVEVKSSVSNTNFDANAIKNSELNSDNSTQSIIDKIVKVLDNIVSNL